MAVPGYDPRSVADVSKQLRAALKVRVVYLTNHAAAKAAAEQSARDLEGAEAEVTRLKEELFDCYEKGL